MKHIMLLLGIFSIVLVTATDIDAQRRTRDRDRDRTRDRDRDRETENFGKIYHTIHMGNLNFFNGNFNLSAKYAGGFKLHERFSAGISGKFFYEIEGRQGPDINLFSYGAGAFVRAKIYQGFYIQGEYALTSYDEPQLSRDIHAYPLIGAGYEQGVGPWTGGLNLMLILDNSVRDLYAVNNRQVEWWFTYSYNF